MVCLLLPWKKQWFKKKSNASKHFNRKNPISAILFGRRGQRVPKGSKPAFVTHYLQNEEKRGSDSGAEQQGLKQHKKKKKKKTKKTNKVVCNCTCKWKYRNETKKQTAKRLRKERKRQKRRKKKQKKRDKARKKRFKKQEKKRLERLAELELRREQIKQLRQVLIMVQPELEPLFICLDIAEFTSAVMKKVYSAVSRPVKSLIKNSIKKIARMIFKGLKMLLLSLKHRIVEHHHCCGCCEDTSRIYNCCSCCQIV